MHNLNYKGLVSDIQGRIKNSTSSQARRKAKALGRPLRMFFEKQALSFIIIDKYPTIKHNKDGTFIFQHKFQSDHLCQIRNIGKIESKSVQPRKKKMLQSRKMCASWPVQSGNSSDAAPQGDGIWDRPTTDGENRKTSYNVKEGLDLWRFTCGICKHRFQFAPHS